MTLTATQKILISDAHASYVGAENVDSDYKRSETSAKFSKLIDLVNQLGISILDAEKISWEVNMDFDRIMLQAIEEGYRNEFLTPQVIANLIKKAGK